MSRPSATATSTPSAASSPKMPPGSIRVTCRSRDVIIGDFLGGVRTLLRPDAPLIIELTNVVSDGTQVVAEWTSRATARDGGAYYYLRPRVHRHSARRARAVRP